MAQPDFSKMNLSPQETKNMTQLMKDPKFMEMFVDYAKEIADPKHKQEMEDALRHAETRGEKVIGFPEGKELLIPIAGFCAKTKDEDTNMKVFINICHSNKIRDCIGKERFDKSGMDWDIPYSLAPPHNDKDKEGSGCIVHDFSVGTTTHQMAMESLRFKKFLVDTAIDAIERQRKVKLCKGFTLPRLKYKGPTGEPKMVTISKTAYQAVPSRIECPHKEASQGGKMNRAVIQGQTSTTKSESKCMSSTSLASTKSAFKFASGTPINFSEVHGRDSNHDNIGGSGPTSQPESNPHSTILNGILDESLPTPDAAANINNGQDHLYHGSKSTLTSATMPSGSTNANAGVALSPTIKPQEVEPKHKVVYRNHLDLAQFWKDKTNLSIVQDEIKEIVVHVHLPGVVQLSDIELSVTKVKVFVQVPGQYKLQIWLKYEVDEENGHANFDKEKPLYQLEVTLPVCKRHTHVEHDSKTLLM